ncbi:MAG: HD-GYP domain-containing protein [Actinomycetota bacterium]|nr:HD-GYP domain-containing protein [Actinomycetota bacterium]
MDNQPAVTVKRLLPYALVATFMVAVAPLLITAGLEERLGLPLWITVPLGALLSLVASFGGAALWKRYQSSMDVVFGDLLLWGWVKRIRVERRLARTTRLIGESGKGWSEDSTLTPLEQADVLQKLGADLEASDPYTHGHTKRVTRHAFMTAKAMGLAPEMVENIRAAASVHDVGKLFVPLDVIRKPGALSDEEFEMIKEHPVRGAELLSEMSSPEIVAMVRHHHERLDGRGYPDRLGGEDIPLGARVIAVADTFDAITSTRSYRSAVRHREAIEILKEEAGTQLDPAAVTAFLSYYSGRSSVGWWATLSTVPQRLLSAVRAWIESTGISLAHGTAAVAVAAVVGGVAPVQTMLGPDRNLFDEQSRAVAVAAGSESQAGAWPEMPASFSEPGSGGRDPDHHASQSRKIGGSRDGDEPSDGSSDTGGSGGDGSTGGGSGSPGTDPTDPGTTDPGTTDPGTGGGAGSGGAGTSVGDVVDDTVDTVGGAVDDTVGTVDGIVGDTIGTVGDVVDGVGDAIGEVGGLLKP